MLQDEVANANQHVNAYKGKRGGIMYSGARRLHQANRHSASLKRRPETTGRTSSRGD